MRKSPWAWYSGLFWKTFMFRMLSCANLVHRLLSNSWIHVETSMRNIYFQWLLCMGIDSSMGTILLSLFSFSYNKGLIVENSTWLLMKTHSLENIRYKRLAKTWPIAKCCSCGKIEMRNTASITKGVGYGGTIWASRKPFGNTTEVLIRISLQDLRIIWMALCWLRRYATF